MSQDRVFFTDATGNPVSHEYFESVGYTQGMQLTGQIVVMIKCKTGILTTALRCETEEDFIKLGPLLYKVFKREDEKA